MRFSQQFFSVIFILAGCGGGGEGGFDSVSSASSASIAQAGAQVDRNPARVKSDSPGSVPKVEAGTGTVSAAAVGSATISSADGSIAQNSVVTFGQTFAQGTAPGTLQVFQEAAALPTQVDVKRRHADGSIRHAILSVRLPAASQAVNLKIKPSTAVLAQPALTLQQATAGVADYRVEITEAGTTYAATLKTALGNAGEPWLSGAVANEWRSRVAPASSSGKHPGLRVLFDARYYSPAQGRVSITIENVEATAARGDRTYNLRILDASGTELFAQTGLKQYFQTRFRKVFQFGGAEPLLAVVDAAALQSSFAIPKYLDADIGSAAVNNLYNSWTSKDRSLFGTGIVSSSMHGAGCRMDIGLLPGWTVIALLSRNPKAYEVMFDAAERAAVYSVHYRDATTGEIININRHPTTTIGSNNQWAKPADKLPSALLPGTTPHQADIAHQPSLNYVPYIVSGDRYYLDEIYFWANWNLISLNFNTRKNQLGLIQDEQLRGQAWAMRSFGQAAWIAPDKHWQKDYFADKVKQNVNWYRANAMPTNPLGVWRGTADWNGSQKLDFYAEMSSQVTHWVSPWMHDFFAVTLAHLTELGFDAKDLRDWSLGFTVKRFTSGSDFNRMDGTAYRVANRLIDGSTIKTMADLNYHTFVNRKTSPPTSLPFTNDAGGYAIQALATLGAAVDAKLVKAEEAYLFVHSEIVKRGVNQAFVNDPTWNLVPRTAVAGLNQAPGIYPGGAIPVNPPPPSPPPINPPPINPPPVVTPPPVLPVVGNLPRNPDGTIQNSWFSSLPLKQWVEVPGSRLLDNIAVPPGYNQGDLTSIVAAWGGAALDTKRHGLHLFGGGHGDGKWNGILFFSLNTYRWTVTFAGTPIAKNTGIPGNYCNDIDGKDSLNADGTPMACHSYYGLAWIPERDELFVGMRHSAVWDLNAGKWRQSILDRDHSPWTNDFQAWAHKGKVYTFCGNKNPLTGASQNGEYHGWVFDPAGTTVNTNGTTAVGSWTAVTGLNGGFACRWNQIAVAMPERGEVFRMRPSDNQTPVHVLALDNLAKSYAVNPVGTGWEGAYNLKWRGGSPPDVSGSAFAPGATRADDRIYILENVNNGRLWEINPNNWSGQLVGTTGAGPKEARAGNYGRFVFDRKHGVLMTMPATPVNGQVDVPNVQIIRVR